MWKSSIKVAIKESKEGDWQKLTEEMNLFLDLHHPHIVACYGILNEEKKDDDGVLRMVNSIVTERCRTDLATFLNDHSKWDRFHEEPLTANTIDMRKYKILEHVSQGLEKLHEMCVLHRDLKSLNILLDGEPGECESCRHSGNWKICDFGEAKVLKTPMLAFEPPLSWQSTIDKGRFQEITGPSLMQAGAQYYCWLHPRETTDEFAADAFPYGALVYLFSERVPVDGQKDTFGQRTPERDRVFAVAGVDDDTEGSPGTVRKHGRQQSMALAEEAEFPDLPRHPDH